MLEKLSLTRSAARSPEHPFHDRSRHKDACRM